MYGFLLRPRWIGFHLLVIVGIVGMIAAGLWQLDRLETRRAFNDRVVQRSDQPVVAVTDLVDGVAATAPDAVSDPRADAWDDVSWRTVTASGTYVPDDAFVVVNRSQNGRAGDNTVVPLLLDDGRVLVVNRGFVPLGVDVPPPPEGRVDVVGIARSTEIRRTGQLSDASDGRLTEVQRIDLDRLAGQLPGPALPIYLDLLDSVPAEPVGFPEPVIRPDLSEGSHLSYAVQWFIFAAAVAVGWVLAVRRSIGRRRLVTDATATPGDGDPRAPTVDGSTREPVGTPGT